MLNEISLLWNDIGMFSDISRLSPAPPTDQAHPNRNPALESSSPEEAIAKDMEALSNKWKILLDEIRNGELLMRLHENTIFNLSELTLKEIHLHNNFKYINQNYNQLLDTQRQLNAKISKAESIYNNYNTLATNERSINALPLSTLDFADKINQLIEIATKARSALTFFESNKSYYKSDFYASKYRDQIKLLFQYTKLFLKVFFNSLTDLSAKHGPTEAKSTVAANLQKVNELLLSIKDDEDELLQVEMYYINARLQFLNLPENINVDPALPFTSSVDVFIDLIKLELASYHVLFNNALSVNQDSVIVSNINDRFNDYLKSYFANTFREDRPTDSGSESTLSRLKTVLVGLNRYKESVGNRDLNMNALNNHISNAEDMLLDDLVDFFNNFNNGRVEYPFNHSPDLEQDAELKGKVNAYLHPLVYTFIASLRDYGNVLTNKNRLHKTLWSALKRALNDFPHFRSLNLEKQLQEVNHNLFLHNNLYHLAQFLRPSSPEFFSELTTWDGQATSKLVLLLTERLEHSTDKMEQNLGKINTVLTRINNDRTFAESVIDVLKARFNLSGDLNLESAEEGNLIVIYLHHR